MCQLPKTNHHTPTNTKFGFKKLSILALFACLWLSPQSAIAKIANCPAIYEGDISYRSHSNFVESSRGNAIWEEYKWDRQKINEHLNEIKNREVLWHTTLIEPDKIINRHLEGDVQANITCVEYTTDTHLIVSDKRNRRFTLNKQTGKLLKTQRYELLYTLWLDEIPIYDQNNIEKLQNFGDYLFTLKRIDYINNSSLTIYKNNIPNNYDIVLNMPDNYFYLSAKQTKSDTLNILETFKKDSTINTKHWVKMTDEQMNDWYHETYIQPKLLKRAN